MHAFSASEASPAPSRVPTPMLQSTSPCIRIIFNGVTISTSSRALQLLWPGRPMETEIIVPLDDVVSAVLVRTREVRECPVTGRARYYDIFVADTWARRAALILTAPTAEFEHIKGYVSFLAVPLGTISAGNDHPLYSSHF